MLLQPRGEAGDVLDELLLGGEPYLVCIFEEPHKVMEVGVIYVPASGELAGRECKLTPSFVEDFLRKPRRPESTEYSLLSPSASILDLNVASGHMARAENSLLDSDRARQGEANLTTPPPQMYSSGRWGVDRFRRGCGMRCGMRSMNLRRAPAQAAKASDSTALESAGDAGLTQVKA